MQHIIVPVHNRYEHTSRLLENLERQLDPDFCVYLIDDGSTDGTADKAQSRFGASLNLKIIKGNGDLWWTGAIETGVKHALTLAQEDDWLVFMNNDVTCTENFIQDAKGFEQSNPSTIFSPLVVDVSDKDTVLMTGIIQECWPISITSRPFEGQKLSNLKSDINIVDVNYLGGRSTFIPASIIRTIGNVDSQRLPHYHADSEFSHRARANGFRVCITSSFSVYLDELSTGSFASFKKVENLFKIPLSFFERRSCNNIIDRYHFALLCCPKIFIPTYLISEFIKISLRSLIASTFGSKVRGLRNLVNSIFRKKYY